MGCDIHIWTEVRNTKTYQWEKVGSIFPNPRFEDGDDVNEDHTPLIDEPYDDRNYRLFAILANVRNYGNVRPISKPRKLPVDITPEVMAKYNEWGSDAHSPSWLILAELMAYRPENDFEQQGYDDLKLIIQAISPLGNPGNVRVVFFFDN